MSVKDQALAAKEASYALQSLTDNVKRSAIEQVAGALEKDRSAILSANAQDVEKAESDGLAGVLLKRLILDDAKFEAIIGGVREVASLPDPVGRILHVSELDDGLILTKLTVPIGLIGVVFESRPDALVQIASLCAKSANAVVLKGGSEAAQSNERLFQTITRALTDTDSRFNGALQLVSTRQEIRELLALDSIVDLMIPRGSNKLVSFIKENTRIPVLGHADGICHLYVDGDADIEMALQIAVDAKCQYPAVCNSIETLLVHASVAAGFLPLLADRLADVELRGDERVRETLDVKAASEEDWSTEYGDLILSVAVVDSIQDAVDHINRYGSHHTDAIVTADGSTADRFMNLVDSSSVLWNASTRFADGYRFGFGAEVGISTSKIHARGPVGLEGLTTYKYKVSGNGQIVSDYVEGRRRFKHRELK